MGFAIPVQQTMPDRSKLQDVCHFMADEYCSKEQTSNFVIRGGIASEEAGYIVIQDDKVIGFSRRQQSFDK